MVPAGGSAAIMRSEGERRLSLAPRLAATPAQRTEDYVPTLNSAALIASASCAPT